MPEETLDLTKIHVDEYPKTREITKIIMDYLNNSNVDSTAISFELESESESKLKGIKELQAGWLASHPEERAPKQMTPKQMTPEMAQNNRREHIRLLLRFEKVDEIYKKYNKDMAPEIAKLYRAWISAKNDNSMDAVAYMNVMYFLSVIMGYLKQHRDDTHVDILIKMINEKKIDEDFAYRVLSKISREYFDVSYGETTFTTGKEEMALRILKTMVNMPQASVHDMMCYACALTDWEEILKVENDAQQKLDAQLKAEFENYEIPDASKINKILSQWRDLDEMLDRARKFAPDDKKAVINAERDELAKKYHDNDWIGTTTDNGYETKYDKTATSIVSAANERANNAEEKLKEKEEEFKEKDDEIARLMEQIKKLEAEKEKLSSDLSEQKRKTQDERDINNRLEKENEQLKTTNASLQQQNDIMRGTVTTFVEQAKQDFENGSRLTRGVHLLDNVKQLGEKIKK